MPTMVATHKNPVIAFYNRLLAAGKPGKVALGGRGTQLADASDS